MFHRCRRRILPAMKVTIALTDHQPPVGTVVVDEGEPIEFAGWLGLMNLLGGVVDAAAEDHVRGNAARVHGGGCHAGDSIGVGRSRGRWQSMASKEG